MSDFVHLHLHTQYSILDGATPIDALMDRAVELGMPAVAITDHGNMFGIKHFFDAAKAKNIKPILGCEVYLAPKGRKDKSDIEDRSRFHLILLAKNINGYHNLIKMVSMAYLEGFYYKPRIDWELLNLYHEDLIACSSCLAGELPRAARISETAAEEVLLKYIALFGEDFYIELQDHGHPEQKQVNPLLIKLARKHGVDLIATNDVHYLNEKDAEAQDILLCLSTGKDINDTSRMKFIGQEFFKTVEEMSLLFPDAPESISNTLKVAEKIEFFDLKREVLLPEFKMPEAFETQDDYLHHLAYEGSKRRYPEMTDAIRERIDFELCVIAKMKFAGYFLIVQDFIRAARERKVSVGPGRGSAAGSAVAYCIGITDIDPIKYKLLFERFLNPERISMPDIDIDFDDDGREEVMKYVLEKYGKERVAQVITFGSMGAKMAIRDVARVINLPLPEANRLAKLIPDGPDVTLTKAFADVPELKIELSSGDPLIRKTLEMAKILEGSIRQTGIHACGVIIGRDPLIDHIPVAISKETDLMITQFDGHYLEEVGMLKMDFLGLKTLSIIRDALENIKLSRGIDVVMDTISYEDPKTFELYQKGETVGTFQFESPGMRAYLKDLKPTTLEDLIAMNALYRPGPMQYINGFIKRKFGLEVVEYPHPWLEEILKDTYGIMVYQEQIMQTAQVIGGFSLAKADNLRRAMGKKKMDVMESEKAGFIIGAEKNGVDKAKAVEIFDIMMEFANYGFNRSHSAGYAVVAFQTAYLKAHYPAEYMAAVLTRNLNDIKKITFIMDECRRMGMQVLGPDVNESYLKFTVNKDGNIRFGLAAVKGIGAGIVEALVQERNSKGPFKDIYDMVERISLKTLNKKVVESMAVSGALDDLSKYQRFQFFSEDEKGQNFIEQLLRYGAKVQDENAGSQISLFGGISEIKPSRPEPRPSEPWSSLQQLNLEKEHVGIYLSAHPLDEYRLVIDHFTNSNFADLQDISTLKGKDLKLAGIVTSVEHKITKNGKPFGRMSMEDFSDTHTFTFFSPEYLTFKNYMQPGYALLLSGKVEAHRFNEGEFEFKVKEMNLLADVGEKMIKSVTLTISLDSINKELVNEIVGKVQKYKGKTMLKFKVYESLQKISIDLFSRSFRVELNKEFLLYLKNHPEFDFKID
ncbi:MAG: DNA polymerase III subunit alpha [Bacteroidales bacterium]|jgi:DNA polymerase-3 subunit alpha